MSHPEPPSSPLLPVQRRLLPHRKRSLSPCYLDANASSDPPVFSSDPPDPSVDNYIQGRKKRRHIGPWWAGQSSIVPHTPRNKSQLTRNVDSGVWLPSDASDVSSFGASSTFESIVTTSPLARMGVSSKRQEGTGVAGPRGVLSLEELEAQEKIQQCLELGEERIDLAGLSLRSLSNETLRPLHSMIRPPLVTTSEQDPEDYKPFTPSIQLFLSRNSLQSTPPELWQLQNLTVLSLRNNNLRRIPPSIANLSNLVELNVANNNLRWLPWELLSLVGNKGPLRHLAVLPNPLFQGIRFHGRVAANRQWRFSPVYDEIDAASKRLQEKVETVVEPDKREQLAWLLRLHETFKGRIQDADTTPEGEAPVQSKDPMAWKLEPVFIASTPVSYIEFDGSTQPQTPELPSGWSSSTQYLPASVIKPTMTPALFRGASKVPSLFELCIRQCQELSGEELLEMLPPDPPEPILRAVGLADEARQCGGLRCSVCTRDYVVPRTEWVEYWHYVPDSLTCSTENLFLPFLRAGCSWACNTPSSE